MVIQGPSMMLTIKPRMVIICLVYHLITFKLMSFWYSFLEPYITTYHTNIGVHLKRISQWHMSTLNAAFIEIKKHDFDVATIVNLVLVLLVSSWSKPICNSKMSITRIKRSPREYWLFQKTLTRWAWTSWSSPIPSRIGQAPMLLHGWLKIFT